MFRIQKYEHNPPIGQCSQKVASQCTMYNYLGDTTSSLHLGPKFRKKAYHIRLCKWFIGLQILPAMVSLNLLSRTLLAWHAMVTSFILHAGNDLFVPLSLNKA